MDFEAAIIAFIVIASIISRIVSSYNKREKERQNERESAAGTLNTQGTHGAKVPPRGTLEYMQYQAAQRAKQVDQSQKPTYQNKAASGLAQLQAQLMAALEDEETVKERKRREQAAKAQRERLERIEQERARLARQQQTQKQANQRKNQPQSSPTIQNVGGISIQSRRDLVQGIIMSEVLGPPKGRRASG